MLSLSGKLGQKITDDESMKIILCAYLPSKCTSLHQTKTEMIPVRFTYIT